MIKTEKCFDIDELTRNNFHTHSVFSLCSKPEMVFESMVKKAEECGLKTLAITDHSDPGDDIDSYGNFLILKDRLSRMDTPVRVLIGAELSAYGVGKFAEPREVDRALDWASYSCVHYHLDCWEHPQDRSPSGYAAHMLEVLEALFATDRADSIAHPFSPGKMKFFSEEERKLTLASITDNQLGDIMEKGEAAGCAWELHYSTLMNFPEFAKRFWNTGKEVGVHFTFGTDAHTLASLDTRGCGERLKEILL